MLPPAAPIPARSIERMRARCDSRDCLTESLRESHQCRPQGSQPNFLGWRLCEPWPATPLLVKLQLQLQKKDIACICTVYFTIAAAGPLAGNASGRSRTSSPSSRNDCRTRNSNLSRLLASPARESTCWYRSTTALGHSVFSLTTEPRISACGTRLPHWAGCVTTSPASAIVSVGSRFPRSTWPTASVSG
jgi:hypothetical protein